MNACVVIPARYGSTRFPGKPLAMLRGKPVIQHVFEGSSRAGLVRDVIVATDSREIFECVEGFGGKAVLTSPDHLSGTDRIAEAVKDADYDIIVNVQGDEPLIRGEMIDQVVMLLDDDRADMGTLAVKSSDPSEFTNPNVVKVVTDKEGFALYFSRAGIPYHRDGGEGASDGFNNFLKHVGIYSYRQDVLMHLTRLEPAPPERTEKLEQLRALYNGYRIKVGITERETIGVDTPEDLKRVEKWLNSSS
ncbi:MAG: 3-deoxy-manno-octulosonate cytidylyltransferase [Nitrospirae bacterium]|nr:MAG: 3-deoxy-manno-octulosonate cytidylyltransferase [Nitrospirota bacterium]